ncbi:DNA mismatch repair protein MutS [Clostridium tetanomorphum DSM 665]|uniref:DNA mismatch repair protein MutS n=1 Tax=Clostridium tetanomorphum TaxID=1553 RepID=A0A923ED47_CLOTT|nr:DNA mismatch repair protein MutS [Clostridium tetanomorphum]KAJ52519.1 DNA mismatch repair protein MutS [Clostridium tetanomorphum DSM 665]MBC2399801.1 DNA mismatch repair protein MutS [Clostridium tetanomorphum]NRZ97826.1 DNA mismatch repair protein MutS [Clostridium tetanomorphum]SQB91889.1 DNA mismatch repair protein MutS [Clostridium tetanomorphum]
MALTPMMQQYLEVKEKCKDCILFFRLGDFYEMFFNDAEVASKELELVLTGRDCGLENRAPMCGVPYHSANTYISRLISKGYKIAICEQLEDPALAKGIVKRDIIKIITPGTYTDSSFLEENKNNYIMNLYIDTQCTVGLCFCDLSTGEFFATDSDYNEAIILDEISKFSPSEILISETTNEDILNIIKSRFNPVFTKLNEKYYSCNDVLEKQFSDFNKDTYSSSLIKSGNALLKYIFETQKTSLSHIDKFQYYNIIDFLSIDINSRRNLELTETLRDKSKKGSLLWIMDKTNTSMGGRQLRKWIEQPLINKNIIEDRLNSVEEFLKNLSLHEDLKESLKDIYDIERIVGKVSSKSVNAKELLSLKNSIEKIPNVKSILKNFESNLLHNMYKNLDELKDIYKLLDDAIMDNPSLSVKEGNIIKKDYNKAIDELREAKSHGKEWIANLESTEREITGIKSLKVGYNKVFGYYIEVTKSNLSSIPEGRYIRKQTLANAERYITPELKEMEDKILGAEEKLINLEYEVFVSIRDNIENHIDRMKSSATIIANLDCLSSLATIALENNYCKPEITEDDEIYIEEGRHPVVEKMIPTGNFVANDTLINTGEDELLLITGPNMAGKSTYMRQVALIVIMAQIGSFIPANKGKISICDKIFTRIGASDDLAAGKSTFMVEMWEVSNILKNATNKSLILLDEVGRGTSTFDGLSIAWAVIEYICTNKNLRCKTLFATHYHELTHLESEILGVKNYSVSVKEIDKDIVFLRKIIRGGADQSYGIEVAKLAGLPKEVIKRAKEILSKIEGDNDKSIDVNNIVKNCANDRNESNNCVALTRECIEEKENNLNKKDYSKIKEESLQLGFTDIEKDNLIKEISAIDIMNITPFEGFNKLNEIIRKARSI